MGEAPHALCVSDLTCESLQNPMAVDERIPQLSWQVDGDGRDRWQCAYRIVVDTDRNVVKSGAGGEWDSGPVASDATLHVCYGGRLLRPRTRYWWSVEVWDEHGKKSTPSEIAWWETGWMGEAWPGCWLTRPGRGPEGVTPPTDTVYDNEWQALPVAHLRRSFFIERPVQRAKLYATALGVYEPRLNGQRVSPDVLSPGWTDYHRRVEHQTYDVTPLLQRGENVIGALLGEGWYSGYIGFLRKRPAQHYGNEPQFRAVLDIELDDGGWLRVVTDPEWRFALGPHVFSDLLHGERYDARLEQEGWDRAGFDDSAWVRPGVGRGSKGAIEAARAPPIRVTRTLSAKTVHRAPDGSWVFDLGQNMVGRVRLTVRNLARGALVRMQHAEALNEDGSVYVANLRSTRQEDAYVARGASEEIYEPTFTVHGFRFVAVRDLQSKPELDTIVGKVIHNELPETSSFECSSALLNQLHANIVWGQRGNFLAVPTDCPQRDERMGWTADAQLFARTAAYNMDIAAFFGKWMIDIRDAQSADGVFQNIAPCAPFSGGGAPAWGDAGVILPVLLFEFYGDKRLLRRCYPSMRAWMSYIERHNPSGVRDCELFHNFGDWLSIDAETPKTLLATAYYAWQAKLMQKAAIALGLAEDAVWFDSLYAKVRTAFNEAFVTEDGMVEGDTQTGYLLALFVDLLPGRQDQGVAHLVRNIESRGVRLSTGFIGVRHLCPILTEYGHGDLAYRLALSESFPSWGYSIRHGATTIWERWDGWTPEVGFQSPKMNSFNHFALGSIGEWLFEYVVGIGDDRSGDAFKRIRLRPTPGPGIDWCRGSYRSARGLIESHWRIEGEDFIYECLVPANTMATLELPVADTARVGIDGAVVKVPVAQPQRHHGRTALELGSGRYRIHVTGGLAPCQQPQDPTTSA